MAKKTLPPEEIDLFRESIGAVNRIISNKHPLNTKKPKPFPNKQSIDFNEKLIEDAEFEHEKLSQEDKLSFAAPGLQKNVLKKLRQGHYGLDAEIDLHGLNSREAKQQLLRFLHYCVEDGCRCVHIIHGKGYRSADNHPVLKNNLNIWLQQHQDVQAFCSALPKDGGTGAVLVLLRLSEKYREKDDTEY